MQVCMLCQPLPVKEKHSVYICIRAKECVMCIVKETCVPAAARRYLQYLQYNAGFTTAMRQAHTTTHCNTLHPQPYRSLHVYTYVCTREHMRLHTCLHACLYSMFGNHELTPKSTSQCMGMYVCETCVKRVWNVCETCVKRVWNVIARLEQCVAIAGRIRSLQYQFSFEHQLCTVFLVRASVFYTYICI